MIDLTFVREHPEAFEKICVQKLVDVDVRAFLEVDSEWRELQAKIQELNEARNRAAKKKDIGEGKRLKDEAASVLARLAEVEIRQRELAWRFPNLPEGDTPVGTSEADNVIDKTVGEKPVFDFEPRAHWELGEGLRMMDKERAARVSGSRFAYLFGDLVRLQYALVQFAFDTLLNEEALARIARAATLDVSTKPFVPVLPPLLMQEEVMRKMGRLEPREERYHIPSDNLYLIGSAEHTLGPLHMDELIDAGELPLRYVAFTQAFRREAGSYGKDTKGMIRLHQFDKTEMESFTLPEDGRGEHEFFVAIQEDLTGRLGLPYNRILKCTADQGTPNARGVDIDTWMAGQGTFRETHTADYMTDFQARRLNTRVKRQDGTKAFVHMNDATVMAGRTLLAVMEAYQEADGSIRVPEILRPYMNKEVIRA